MVATALPVRRANAVNCYTVAGHQLTQLPKNGLELSTQSHSKRRKAGWRNGIQLIQDFGFPEASYCLRVTQDGSFLMATGVYKPQIHVYDFSEMSLKFERHTDAENVCFEMLSDDWTKSIHLQNDRSLEFHTQGGFYTRVRIPMFGRDLKYHEFDCECYVAANGPQVYRLNLEYGRFMQSLELETADYGVNAVHINPAHHLLGFATSTGTVEFWDARVGKRIGLLDVLPSLLTRADFNQRIENTAINFNSDGLTIAVGTSIGYTMLYDLRSSLPTMVKDQGYGFPIKKIHWIEQSSKKRVLSADKKIIKIWDRNDGNILTSIEPPSDLNDVEFIKDSGLIMSANEGCEMHAWFIPQLGPAPRWCSFLENLTEEMEESKETVLSDNYKFITKKELADIGLAHLVGTKMLRPYMHGYFLDSRLYEQARLIANPFSYQEYREKILKQKIESKRENRIRTMEKPKVNSKVKAINDARFSKFYQDEDFEIAKDSLEYELSKKEYKFDSEDGLQSESDGLESDDSGKSNNSYNTELKKKPSLENKKAKPTLVSWKTATGHVEKINKSKSFAELMAKDQNQQKFPWLQATKNTIKQGSQEMAFKLEKVRNPSVIRDSSAKRSASKNTFRKIANHE